jgi:Putative metal-binding motif
MRVLSLLVLAGCSGQSGIVKYNDPPAVNILAPASGQEFNEGQQLDFQAKVVDDTTPAEELVVQWTSSIDGILSEESVPDSNGSVVFSTASLSVGNHVITLKAIDREGEEGTYGLDVSIKDVPDAPTLTVVHPIPGESGVEGYPFTFSVQVGDEQDPLDTLAITFSSNLAGSEPFCTPVADALGVAECDYPLGAGDHTLSFEVIDSDGLNAKSNVIFPVTPTTEIDDDGDHFSEVQGDCDDTNPNTNPLGTEVYDNLDNDCDGIIDDGTVNFDDDFDGQKELDGDCNDGDPSIYLGAPEQCDGRDNDCDNILDETTSCYDDDGDGVTETYGDCDDSSALAYPGAPEVEDGVDNDCDGNTDEGTAAFDDDGDGVSENGGDCNDTEIAIYPGATESCDGYDNDCDGQMDPENSSGCSNYYYDYDADSYGADNVSPKCLCGVSGGYTTPYAGDCYDYNSTARPGNTTPSSSALPTGSYDWDCDGRETKQDTASGSCSGAIWICSWTAGWSGSVPACGARQSYITDCGDWNCSTSTENRIQSCL